AQQRHERLSACGALERALQPFGLERPEPAWRPRGDYGSRFLRELEAAFLALERRQAHRQPCELERPGRLVRAGLEEQEGGARVVVALACEEERAHVLGETDLEGGADDEGQLPVRRRYDDLRAYRREQAAAGQCAEHPVANLLAAAVRERPLLDRIPGRSRLAERHEDERVEMAREREVGAPTEAGPREPAPAPALDDHRPRPQCHGVARTLGRPYNEVERLGAVRPDVDVRPFELL